MKKIFFVTLFCLLGFVPKGFTFDYSHFPPLPENPNPSYYTEVAGSGDPTYFYAFFCYVHNKDAWILPHASSNGFTYLEHPALQLTGTIDDMVCWHKPYDSTEWLQPQSFWYAGATSVDYYYALQLPVDSYFFSSFDLKSTSNASFNGNYGLYDVNAGDTLLTANYQATLQLTVARSPEAGGGVASLSGEETQPNCEAEDGLFCGTCGHNYCVGSAPNNSTVKFGAFPNSGYAFAYWSWNAGGSSSTANPEIFTLSGDLGLVGVFKKTFTCTNGSFQQASGYYGECVPYVRYETGLPWDDFHGDADTTFQQAIDNGYTTGSEPRESAIIVFDRSSLPDVGHVGIVFNIDANNNNHFWIHDANWNRNGIVQSHEILDITQYNIKGYIYCTPQE